MPSERQLMAVFGAGRTAVREALVRLQRVGLVEFRAGSRACVAAPGADAVMNSLTGRVRYSLSDEAGLRHFQEARTLFESGLVRDGASTATAKDIHLLGVVLEANLCSIGDMHRRKQSDVTFHYAIVTILNNPICEVLHGAIIGWGNDQRRMTLNYPGQNRIAYAARALIFKGVKPGEQRAADPRMRSHLAEVAGHYWKVRRRPK